MTKGQKQSPDPLSKVLADEIEDQGPLQDKLNRYSLAKARTTEISEYILNHVPEMRKYNKALFDCGSWLVFRNYYEIQKHRLIKANLCKKHLLCGLCALRRSALQVKAFEPKLAQVMSENPNLIPLLITYTVKNGLDLAERFEHITVSRKKMTKRRNDALRGKKTDTILKYVYGGAGSYEVKRGSGSGLWHPHIHEIVLVDKNQFTFTQLTRKRKKVLVPLQFENALRNEWKKQTDGSHMVDVRKIESSNENDKFGAICEAFKYALKIDDFDQDDPEQGKKDQIHAAGVLQGRRLQFSYGLLHGVKINENLTDNIENELSLQPYVDLVYQHNHGTGYSLVETTDFGDLSKQLKEDKEDFQHRKRKQNTQETISKKQSYSQVEVDIWLDNKKEDFNFQMDLDLIKTRFQKNKKNPQEPRTSCEPTPF